MDPLNMIVRQIHKPNMLILLDTSGSMTGVPGGAFDNSQEVGVDCDDGVNCRLGAATGTCSTSGKSCSTDDGCQAGSCASGAAECWGSDSDCPPIAGSCETGHACFGDSDCPPRNEGHCAQTGASCSLSTPCTTQYRCRYGSLACASDADCDPGICANGTTTCDTADNCPYASTGGSCAYGATPSGGCSSASDCPLRAKVCSNDPSKTCSSVNDCGGFCTKDGRACTSNEDCKKGATDYCNFAGRSCSAPSNTCLLPRQTCTQRYTDNRCENLNTCVGDPNPCNEATNRCLPGTEGDVCNAPSETSGVRMCRITQRMCGRDSDCSVSGDACGPATSRMVIAKRVVRNIVSANANVVNLGLMTYHQAGYYPYYALESVTSEETGSVDIKQGSLRAAGCYSKRTGVATSCTINGKTYRLKTGKNAKYLIKGHGSSGSDKYIDAEYCGWFCSVEGGTGIFKGAYYEFEDKKGRPIDLVTFPTYQGKTFVKDGITHRYYDARADYYNGGTPPPIEVADCSAGICSEKCGGRWDTQLAPFMSTDDSQTQLDQVITHFNQALEYASYGGLIAYGPAPTGCALLNDQVPDKSHSAYHYMQEVKAADPLQCRLNYVMLVTDGEARGPGDSNCGTSACAADDPIAGGCTCRAVISAYLMRKNLGVKTIVVGFSTDGATGSGFATNDNIAKAGGTDLGNDGRSPYAYGAANETALHEAIQDAIYTTVEGSYATSPSTASQGVDLGNKYTSGAYVLDSRVDFPSWRGHLIAYDVSGETPQLKWDAAVKLESSDWKQRRVYTSDKYNNLIRIDVDPSTGTVRNADVLHNFGRGPMDVEGSGLGANPEEAEKIVRWMMGDPALKNPAVLGAIINSTPVDVGPPADGPLPGQHRFYEAQKLRPPITYVGSNDGMLHAFFTRDVTIEGVFYEGGTEAFAYLPPNMLPMVTKLYAQGGQLADPKQHIYGGLANSPKSKNLCVRNCASDTEAEWATLLVVTQGWGGNEIFMLDVTSPLLYPRVKWSSIMQGWPLEYDKALGLTVSVPAFTYFNTDPMDEYRILLASGYAVNPEGYPAQGRTFLSVRADTGEVKDVEVLPGSGWCPQEYTLIADVATSRKQYPNAEGKYDGRKEFLTAYVGDTWGKLWRYGPDAELIHDFGCDQPIFFSPTLVQLNADDPTNPTGGDAYLVQVTNSALDDDTMSFGPSRMIIAKEINNTGRPTLDTSFGVNGFWQLSTSNTKELCGVTDATGDTCYLDPNINQRLRPLSTPMAMPKADGTGFYIMSNWYVPDTAGCGKGTSYFMVHDFSGSQPQLKQGFKIADEPVVSPVVVAGKLIVSSSQGPVIVDGSVTTRVVNTSAADTHKGDVFEAGGWSELP